MRAQRKDHVRTWHKKDHLQPGERTLTANWPCQYFDLGLLASRLWENKVLWFKPPSWWHFVIAAKETNRGAELWFGPRTDFSRHAFKYLAIFLQCLWSKKKKKSPWYSCTSVSLCDTWKYPGEDQHRWQMYFGLIYFNIYLVSTCCVQYTMEI